MNRGILGMPLGLASPNGVPDQEKQATKRCTDHKSLRISKFLQDRVFNNYCSFPLPDDFPIVRKNASPYILDHAKILHFLFDNLGLREERKSTGPVEKQQVEKHPLPQTFTKNH